MSDSAAVNLQFKKRARHRLIGAIAFAGLVAVVLPMVMDDEPKQQVQDVEVRILGQDEAPFAPKLEPAESRTASDPAPAPEAALPPETVAESPPETPAEKPAPAEKPVVKPTEKPVAKPAEKPAAKPTARQIEAQRAEAILSGRIPAEPASAAVPYVILIGAFAKPGNVKILQTKIGELGIKVYTEPLESPEGMKTRVRAGPFPNRAAAERALERMKRIGVNGVIAAKQ
jgi:DedD protein